MNLSEWLAPKYQDQARVEALRKRFRSAQPFAHIVLDNLLKPQKKRALEVAVRKQQFVRKEADLFSFAQSPDLHSVGDKTIGEFLTLLKSKEFASFINTITGTATRQGKVDASAFIYSDGDHLLCHDDGVSSRKVAYVYHMSTLSARQGGALSLFSSGAMNEPTGIAKRIAPRSNTLILFKVTKRSHHQVDEVLGAKRMTIAGWFHA